MFIYNLVFSVISHLFAFINNCVKTNFQSPIVNLVFVGCVTNIHPTSSFPDSSAVFSHGDSNHEM